jgi:hypothetical protein
VKSLVSTLLVALFGLSAAVAYADSMTVDIGSPWFDSEYVQVNPSSEGDKQAPQPAPDTDKEKQ